MHELEVLYVYRSFAGKKQPAPYWEKVTAVGDTKFFKYDKMLSRHYPTPYGDTAVRQNLHFKTGLPSLSIVHIWFTPQEVILTSESVIEVL